MPYEDVEVRRAYHKKWCEEHPEEMKSYYRRYETRRKDDAWISSRKLKHAYGILLEDYIRMETEQDFKCAICKKQNLDGKRLYVDHNHDTGKVRALLCRKCNSILGYADENIDILKSSIEYLQLHNRSS